MNAEPDVVVVGAGAAGIAAARRLSTSDLSWMVLEATSRVGGRAWTSDVAGMRLDLGCGWLHSADRNPWTELAAATGFAVDRSAPGFRRRYHDTGVSQAEQAAARRAYADWEERMESAALSSDCAADALDPRGEWNAYLQAISGFMNGARLEQISVADYTAYESASTSCNWRLPAGYGTLIASSLPHPIDLRLSAPVQSVELGRRDVEVTTAVGALRARAVILTVSTAVLAAGAIRLPPDLDAWRHAAACLPLGRDEKLFLEIAGENSFDSDTRVIGNPRDYRTGVYNIRPFGWPVIECFLGGDGARAVEEAGPAVGFAYAIDQLADLFGSNARLDLRPLIASSWGRMKFIGGAYSHALPAHSAARKDLALPFDERVFFAGEATHPNDFSTAHGAYQSGWRAADEAIAVLSHNRA
jgi:monoamine oxidase